MWTIQQSGGSLFDAPIDQRYRQLIHQTNTPPLPARHVLHQLRIELAELNVFTDKLTDFLGDTTIADPTKIMSPVYEPNQGILIPDVYALISAGWEAYFRLNFSVRTATGIYIRDVSAPLTATLSSILAAL